MIELTKEITGVIPSAAELYIHPPSGWIQAMSVWVVQRNKTDKT